MIISLSFSVFIYRMVSFEIQMRVVEIERRLDLGHMGFVPPPGQSQYFYEDVREAQNRVLLVLVYTNVVILVFSSLSGYFLAGTTLHPIENALEEQKRFIADASHELRTPLTALQTSIEVAIRDRKISLKEALFTLSDSLKDIKSLTTLTNDLLSLTRYQQSNLKTSFEKINVRVLISESLAKIDPIAKEKKIDVKLVGSDRDVFYGSREDLGKLFTILLDNAVKYTSDRGNITVEHKTKGKNTYISVKDTGIGIPEKDLPFIFERFYRSDVSRSKVQVSGFGLGLSIAKSIVEAHGGTIMVESKVGKGSVFKIKLPLG
jgi:two-component system, OmpR family, sensor histidine kinase CiaH